MYLKKLVYKNVGPLVDVSIDMPFNENGTPKPLVLVGENGSGKSTLLSNIVDSFYEMAGGAFDNVRASNNNNSYQYYKIMGGSQITIGQQYLYSYIKYDESVDYIFKCGTLSFDDFKSKCEEKPLFSSWKDESNYKSSSIAKENAKKVFNNNIFVFFGPDRYEKPSWMGGKYFNTSDYEHPSIEPRYADSIVNPISAKNVTAVNLQWLLDLIVDSRADILIDDKDVVYLMHYPNGEINNYRALGNCRKQVERIMSQIIKQDVYFDLNIRNHNSSRFSIRNATDNKMIVPQLDALSTGETALFNMFATIVKYADRLEINNSLHLENIKGIVVIDEIELHLHSSMQNEVLPKLIKLFPQVQFVITTHSPLFLLGMSREFGEEGFEICQLPSGMKITTESFSEFQQAFDYMIDTQRYQDEVNDAIQKASVSKTLIVTEGATDWRHIKAALSALSLQEKNNGLFEENDVEFLEFDPKNSSKDSESSTNLEMGNSTLCSMCKEHAKLKQPRKIIFIADRDHSDTNKTLGSTTEKYRNWGNNVYSIILPIPSHRKTTPNICIEHYYTDDEIKTPVTIEGIDRRLYMANEFDEHGRGINEDIICVKENICGANKINIIEGSQGERVLSSQHGCDDNLALSKMEFAKRVLRKEAPFDNFSFDSFLELFKIIDEIIKLPLEL